MTEKLAQCTDVRTALVVGGLSMQVQASTLKTSPEIVVATPVSLTCHYPKPAPCIVVLLLVLCQWQPTHNMSKLQPSALQYAASLLVRLKGLVRKS